MPSPIPPRRIRCGVCGKQVNGRHASIVEADAGGNPERYYQPYLQDLRSTNITGYYHLGCFAQHHGEAELVEHLQAYLVKASTALSGRRTA